MAQDPDVTSAPSCKLMVLLVVLPPLVWIAIFLLPVAMVPYTSRVLFVPPIRMVPSTVAPSFMVMVFSLELPSHLIATASGSELLTISLPTPVSELSVSVNDFLVNLISKA